MNEWKISGKLGRVKVAGKATFATIVAQGGRGPTYIDTVSFTVDLSRYQQGDEVVASGRVEMRKSEGDRWYPQLVVEAMTVAEGYQDDPFG